MPDNENIDDGILEVVDVGEDNPDKLIAEDYSYENMLQNPIVKPIAETDASLKDIDEMIYKKLTDAKRDQQWINAAISDVPAYSDSPFIARLIKLAQETQDVIKLQDIQIKKLRVCVKGVHEIVGQKYGVREDETVNTNKRVKEKKAPEAKIPPGTERKYLENISKSSDKIMSKIGKGILEKFDADTENDNSYKKFHSACYVYYKELTDKKEKEIVTQIINGEIKT